MCVWSQACDNEPCPCHHTLCSLRGEALQWKGCKESQRFNYPFHLYLYLLTHSGVFVITHFGIFMFSHNRAGCCLRFCCIVSFTVFVFSVIISSLKVCWHFYKSQTWYLQTVLILLKCRINLHINFSLSLLIDKSSNFIRL